MAAWWNRRSGGANGVKKIKASTRQGPVFEKLEERIMLSAAAAATWSNVAIEGGGFVTGIVYNQSTPNLVYARTDIGGAYRWNPTNSTWTPITDTINAPGVLGLATDPINPNRVYIAAGLYTASWASDASFYYSTNQGSSWTQVSLPFKLGGNEDGRGAGERLQVDPNNDSILYLGTNNNGLWKSTNYGQSWSQVTSFSPSSVTFVLFNKASGSSGNATSDIYVGVNTTSGPNLYESTDAGNSWAPVANEPTNGMLAYRAEMDSSGRLYVTYDNALGPNNVSAGAVWSLNTQNGAWTNITPPTGQGGFAGVAVDAENPGTIIVSTLDRWWPGPQGDQIYRSTNGGATWTDLFSSATWNYSSAPYSDKPVSWLTDVEINPFNPNNAIFTTGGGLFVSNNVTNADNGGSTTWSFEDSGLEEMAVWGIIAPPTGSPLLSVTADNGGFDNASFTTSPAAGAFTPNLGSSTSIAFAQDNPNDMVRVGYNAPYGAYSTNDGTSWTAFSSVPPGASSSGPGTIAISANGGTIVWTPSGSGAYYSTNDGASWTEDWGLPANNGTSFKVVADGANSSNFYIYDPASGAVYVSNNGGTGFWTGATGLPTWGGPLVAVPEASGDLWLPTSSGLYRSVNSGVNFYNIGSVQTAYAVAFGKSLSGGYPAIYIYGMINNVTGIFVSNDTGSSWTQINTSLEPFGWSGAPQAVNVLAASPNVYGQIFVGAGGRGLFVGNIAPLPSGWSDQDIGTPGVAGSASYTSANGQWNVSGGGTDIWGGSDQFNFASTTWSGSGTLTAQVNSIENTDSWAKSGVMFRDSSGADATFVDVMATAGNGVTMQWRNATGGQCNYTSIYGINAPVWVQLIRNGNNFTGYYSTDGKSWTLVGTTTVSFSNASNLAGLAVTAHDNSALNTSAFSNVSLVATILTAANTTDTNIGAPGQYGSSTYNATYGDWTVSGGGSDIWGSSDQFNFVSQSWSGDGVLTADVTSLDNTNSWAKAGVMFRNSSAANSPFVDVVLTPGNGVAMQWRDDSGQLGNIQIAGITTPAWVQLVRSGNSFSGYYSTDGSTWTLIGSTAITFSNTSILAGLAVTSHNTSALSIATFSDVTLWQ